MFWNKEMEDLQNPLLKTPLPTISITEYCSKINITVPSDSAAEWS